MEIKMKKPYLAAAILLGILFGCIFAELLMTHDPNLMNLEHRNQPPGAAYYFGTDSYGRDIFSMIWYGGRVSITIGFLAALISTGIAILYGGISGLASDKINNLMMRVLEVLMSIPAILTIIFIQAVIGQSSPLSIAFVIGITGFMNMAKIVQSEVRKTRKREYVIQASCMGGNAGYILWKHMLPELVSPMMFMVVSSMGAAIGTESTLSFLGIGLPMEVISWGTMLAQAQRDLLSQRWWMIFISGFFLILLLLCTTEIGNAVRKNNNKKCSNL